MNKLNKLYLQTKFVLEVVDLTVIRRAQLELFLDSLKRCLKIGEYDETGNNAER